MQNVLTKSVKDTTSSGQNGQPVVRKYPESPLTGLSNVEAAQRRDAGDGNNVRLQTSRTYLQILQQNTFTFIHTILFVIGAVMVLLGLFADAIISVGLVFLNVLIGISQEFRAKQKLDQIALLTRPTARVIRGGEEIVVDPTELVLGDIIVARAGDQIVVDGVVVGDGRMDLDESLLTGESDLVPKTAGSWVMSGSFVVTGTAMYEALRVGADSYANKLTESVRAFRVKKTPLQKDVDFVIRILVVLAILFGVLFGASFAIRQLSAVETVRTFAVIAGLVPNGLFFMVIAAYAMGALRMSGRGALIQQANSVESMSNVNVLCLDKTGTLTANRIHLHEVKPLGDHSEAAVHAALSAYAATTTTGNRTTEALQEALQGRPLHIIDEVPFSSARKWSALAFDDDTLRGIYALGAPEMLGEHLVDGSTLDDAQIDAWTRQGLRVLLFAYAEEMRVMHDSLGQAGMPVKLVPLALVSFGDELRPEARETLAGFAEVGIKLKIISGDHPQTVQALARQAGLPGELKVVSGDQLDALDDEQLAGLAEETTIFGRIRPDQKERLVESLQRRGNYVAMIGDGVNDVMSLKKAQIGIAMQSGSQATRGVADIVLMNDSFAALPRAFTEGQRILNGMQDIVRLFLTRVFYVALLIFGTAVVADSQFFPLVPVHSGLLTFLTVGFPTFALAAWARPGVNRGRLSSVVRFVAPAAVTVALVGLGVYVLYLLRLNAVPELYPGVQQEIMTATVISTARTAMVTVLMLCGFVLVLFVEPPTEFWVGGDAYSGDWRPTFMALAMLAVFVAIMVWPPARNFFQFQVLPLVDYIFLVVVVAIWTIVQRFIWRASLFERLLGIEPVKFDRSSP